MSLVFAGVCSHAPGITGRADRVEPDRLDRLHAAYGRMREAIEAAEPDALLVVGAEHFANFFMNNMPAYCIGMADSFEGPIEDPEWLAIPRATIPGNADLARRLIERVLRDVDVAYAEEWKFDHGIMVPLHFLTPRYDLPVIPANINCQGPPLTPVHRSYAFGEALRRACDAVPERIALIGTGGISHCRRRRTREGSTRTGTARFSTGSPPTTGTRCCPTTTPRPTGTGVRAASRSAPSSPWPAPSTGRRARSGTTTRCRTSPSAARSG